MLAGATVVGLAAFSPVEPQATDTQATNTQATETYKVDPIHTTAIFRIKHLGVTYFYGRFNETTGSFTLNTEDPSQMLFDVQIKTESVDTNSTGRNNHLKSPDFFNAKEFPTISFKSKSVQSSGENMYSVAGDMTLHGVTKPIAPASSNIDTTRIFIIHSFLGFSVLRLTTDSSDRSSASIACFNNW